MEHETLNELPFQFVSWSDTSQFRDIIFLTELAKSVKITLALIRCLLWRPILALSDSSTLISKQDPLIARKTAVEEVFQRYRVADYASNVKLCSLEISQPLNLHVTLVASQKATENV